MLSLKKINHVLLTIVLLELFLGGTGRLLEISAFLTLRMCLFFLYFLLIGMFLMLNKKFSIEVIFIIGYFIIINCLSVVNGFMSGANLSDIFEDIKPLLNIFLICYLAFSVNKSSDISYILKLLKISSIVLVIFHFVFYGIYLMFKDIAILYSTLNEQQGNSLNFIFKGETGLLNYTGDLYLCVGFIVWEQYHRRSFVKYMMLFLIAIAIILTGTRGLILALAGVYFVKWLILKFNYQSLVYISIGFLLLIGVFFKIANDIGDKDESDQIRYEQVSEVIERITPLSIIIGHGYGIGVPIRTGHMEISFLEIFHKQGIVGLGYYLAILIIAYLAYKNCSIKNGLGFYMFILFVFFLSFTNPYVNHPLGITIISIALVSMIKLREFEKEGNVLLFKN